MGEMRNVYKILVGKPEGKRSLVSTRCRWEDNIRADLGEIGRKVVELDSFGSEQGPVVG
jgi:hypothetical protein